MTAIPSHPDNPDLDRTWHPAWRECLRYEPQLLQFEPDPEFTFASFIHSDSAQLAIGTIRQFDRASHTNLTLVGDPGTGKSHLLQAAVHDWRERHGNDQAIYIDILAELPHEEPPASRARQQRASHHEGWLSDFLARAEGRQMIAVDNMDRLAALPLLQEAVLYLFNALYRGGGRMLGASRTPLNQLVPALRRDLASRLLLGVEQQLLPPDDDLLPAILHKMTRDRQVHVQPELLRFLVCRLPRTIPAYASAIDQLDRAALLHQRPMTIPLAKEVLGL
jgi:DnaA family protein